MAFEQLESKGKGLRMVFNMWASYTLCGMTY